MPGFRGGGVPAPWRHPSQAWQSTAKAGTGLTRLQHSAKEPAVAQPPGEHPHAHRWMVIPCHPPHGYSWLWGKSQLCEPGGHLHLCHPTLLAPLSRALLRWTPASPCSCSCSWVWQAVTWGGPAWGKGSTAQTAAHTTGTSLTTTARSDPGSPACPLQSLPLPPDV